jgi:tRNA-dihydrouridine synthase B
MLKLGRIQLSGGLMLAPMAGFTDSPCRRIARRHGASMVFTELVSAEGLVRDAKKTLSLCAFHEEERPIGIQIFGKNPGTMAEAAVRAEEMRPDCIDINFGCCAPKVCGSGCGAALLDDPSLMAAIAEAIVKKVSLPVSAKIRTGPDSSRKNYPEVVKALISSGVSFITVHGRTRRQRFTGSADWDTIREIAEFSSVPVIGNGDIGSHDEAHERLRTSSCAAVMIGRAAVGNPWIFSGEDHGMAATMETVKTHLDLMIEAYGDYGIVLMRKHLARYIHGFRNAAKIRECLFRAVTYEDVTDALERLRDDDEHAA